MYFDPWGGSFAIQRTCVHGVPVVNGQVAHKGVFGQGNFGQFFPN